jgi:diadenosine tetraphosphate (Ap4A) HIT family hydrolase
MINPTIDKFGHPATLVKEYQHWVVLVRPKQVTLGSLVLAAKSSATSYGELPTAAFTEQGEVIATIERALTNFCSYERINYLMLMMVDREVHFHVVPRYSTARTWEGVSFPDTGWPGPPDLMSALALQPEQIDLMVNALSGLF